MDITKMLLEYNYIPQKIQELNQELNDMLSNKRDTETNLKAIKIQDGPNGKGGISNPTLQTVEKLIDRYEERIKDIVFEIKRLMATKEDIEKALEVLNLEEKRLITNRFFQEYKMIKIVDLMNFSVRTCYRIQDCAIDKMQKEIESWHTLAQNL